MANSTLFLLQAQYSQSSQIIEQIQQMATENDAIVLMAESSLLYAETALQSYQCYVLEADASILPEDAATQVQVINYTEFSTLLLQYHRCISLK